MKDAELHFHGDKGWLRKPDFLVTEDECWEWQHSRTRWGYGYLGVEMNSRLVEYRGKNLNAYKWIYLQLVGPVKPGYEVHHTCGNPPCVNPDHLIAMPEEEHHREPRAGQILSHEDVEWIRSPECSLTIPQLMKRFGISRNAAIDARNGQSFGRREGRPNYQWLHNPRKVPLDQVHEVRMSMESNEHFARKYGCTADAIKHLRNGRSGVPLTGEERAAHTERKQRNLVEHIERKAEARRQFTDDQVRYIRTSTKSGRALAIEFQSSPAAISLVKNRKTYRHVED